MKWIVKKKWTTLGITFALLLSMFPLQGLTEEPIKGQAVPKPKADHDLTLWFDKPATDWLEAFPIGNGHLGAMVFGGTHAERIQLNDESLWAGAPVDDNPPEALEHLPEIQRLLLEGKNVEANDLANKFLLAEPPRLRSYQTLGNLNLNLGDSVQVENYRRALDMEKGIVTVTYNIGDVRYTREMFTSAPDDVLVLRITSNQPGKIDAGINLTREKDAEVYTVNNNEIALRGQIIDTDDPNTGPGGEHMRFEARLLALPEGGEIETENGEISVEDADSLTLLLASATDYDLETMDFDRNQDPGKINQRTLNRAKKPYKILREHHVQDHSTMMNRVRLNLGESPNPDLPTDERLAAVKNGAEDPHLIAQYFQFGRYLLMGSSRVPGQLPANLQGIWNEHLNAPWNSDYHTNINLQMNYWPAEVGNLAETIKPLTDFLDSLQIPGRETARKMYGADGWTVHHNTAVFGRTAVHDGIQHGMFPMGGPWMTLPLWEHYEFNSDRQYLEKVAYPLMKGSAEFVLDFLIEDEQGRLVTAPSYSPENSFKMPDTGQSMRLTYAPTMDIEIIYALFERVIAASKILGVDPEFRAEVESALKRLPPLQISERYGTIQEWIKDYEEVEPGHRHVSHLFALHPGDQITEEKTPELYEAAKRTIERRLNHGGAGTGWSRAWTINFFARFKDGDKAYENVLELLRRSTADNLFDLHPPFQIDGNFGGTAGIAEMLVQSHEGEIGNRVISILPALPYAWEDGSFSGLRARGDFELEIDWSQWRAKKIKIKSHAGNKARISYPNINGAKITTKTGKEVRYTVVNDNLIQFDTRNGETYTVADIPDYTPVPSTPDSLNAFRESESTVHLKWNGSRFASTYTVYRRAQSGEDYKKIASHITNTEYTDDDAPVDRKSVV